MIPLWIASALLQARSFIGGALAWFGRNPLVAALVALACLSGLLLHEYEVRGRTIARLTTQAAQFRAAQDEAGKLAQQALMRQQALYSAKANEADNEFNQSLADARHSADVYIAGHRAVFVRSSPAGGAPGGAVASAESGSASVPAPVPGDAVLVSPSDVQACTAATGYAIAAHDWALSLNP